MDMLKDAFVDTWALAPFLAAIYFLIAFLEYRFGDRMNHYMTRLGSMGPVAGALFGCIPQCGFSVVASALYAKRLISIGTLLAVFISTSDEAVPVLLSMPYRVDMVGLLIVIKALIAVIAGITVDSIIRSAAAAGSFDDAVKGHPGCCAHELHEERSNVKALIYHPLLHTAKILAFVFILTSLFNYSVAAIGEKRIGSMLLGGTLLQPVLTALIGLVPNCFASVLLAQLFAKGAISFGSLISGLSAGAGLGLLVLVKENRPVLNTVFVICLLLAVSILAGTFIQYMF
jgi:hypothetical protein